MPTIQTVTILPSLPERLAPLLTLARNLWWTWTPRAIHLFQDMDRELWERCGHNPVALLGSIEQPRLEALERDKIFLARMNEVLEELDRYLNFQTWYGTASEGRAQGRIAYFSAEFGLHESLPFYSGGLGILAGDHMKSASDLGLPMVGVGLLYKHGYFQQYLNPDGWQLETYPLNEFDNMPLTLVRDEAGEPLTVSVEILGREVKARIWSLVVGRVPIYLLDTDVPTNTLADRQITSFLYGGSLETRLQQEMILGIGGFRALRALDLCHTVCHMNEGHSAFMAVERIRCLVEEQKLDFDEALEVVRATNIFTTHTPVPAGIDRFPPELMKRYFAGMVKQLGIGMDDFLALGRMNPADPAEPFCMAVLAIKTASQTNGVSKLHAEVSRRMWAEIWPRIPRHETPITHVTNGVHTLGWLSSEMARLYERYLGSRWIDEPANHAVWERVDLIPDFELWRSRERLREWLIAFARRRLVQQLKAKGAPGYQLDQAEEVLDPEALTIGFARRFATYKRANLIFRDPERLAAILNHKDRPVQIVFAGKAHPKDMEGKELIHLVIQMANRPEFRNRLVFIENYDIEVARNLVQGVDVWLNTPRRPNEASGTSGMKVVANGGLNLSILDGWWVEGYQGDNGWAIGAGEEYDDHNYQDDVESRLLYELLENTVVPMFYTRNSQNIPVEWVATIRNSIKSIAPFFNTNRMVEEYANSAYLPKIDTWHNLEKEQWREAKEICTWKKAVQQKWSGVSITDVQLPMEGTPKVGDRLPIRAAVEMDGLSPEEVRVEAYIGRLDAEGNIPEGHALPLLYTGERSERGHLYQGHLLCLSSGRIGLTLRCYPYRKGLSHKFELGLLTWWDVGEAAE
ncbi:glycosyltransferase family 1 protein [Dissulfurirhabdus thermomarina]|uniref:Glycosyltransferase family 1 protein n=1 Tax=Dissulfurirhabdus thermomarina TaxID=1765737 RepID=A0A6N9TR56_DISTH|nr:alpha-glucan family phosphorylase [Dissulfurirhabdus thermomarina]NDY41927.1 glycosyltransferase family 1 protein [Dissulfurirhabdus thermomarina]NMX23113.1 glycosyltransferase family 1 protein [Dissulfurirhabdus thermomarina]